MGKLKGQNLLRFVRKDGLDLDGKRSVPGHFGISGHLDNENDFLWSVTKFSYTCTNTFTRCPNCSNLRRRCKSPGCSIDSNDMFTISEDKPAVVPYRV